MERGRRTGWGGRNLQGFGRVVLIMVMVVVSLLGVAVAVVLVGLGLVPVLLLVVLGGRGWRGRRWCIYSNRLGVLSKAAGGRLGVAMMVERGTVGMS